MTDMPAPPPPPPGSLLPAIGRRTASRRGGAAAAGGGSSYGGDAGVIRTNDDAQATKLSCVSLGYFRDDALQLLTARQPTAAGATQPGLLGSSRSSSRKPPLINRGTWARHAAMRQATSDFVAACVQQVQQQQQQQAAGDATTEATATRSSSSQPCCCCCQVVSLGAGSDSTWFSLRQQGWPLLPAVRFIELDHQEVVSKKARAVLSSDTLLQLLPGGTTAHTAAAGGPQQQPEAAAAAPALWTKQSGQADGQQQPQCEPPPAAVAAHAQELCGPLYSLVAADLRDSQQLTAALQRGGFDARLPTLYLAECVLAYLEPSEAVGVLTAAAAGGGGCSAPAAIAIYEQTRPDDAFGATMIANLEARGCPLRSTPAVPSPDAQVSRLLAAGWDAGAAADMAAVYYGGSSVSVSGGAQPFGLPHAPAPAAAPAAAAAGGDSGWLAPSWQSERRRIESLEFLDELEEWRLLQAHYCLVLGVRGDGPDGWLARAMRLPRLAALGAQQQ